MHTMTIFCINLGGTSPLCPPWLRLWYKTNFTYQTANVQTVSMHVCCVWEVHCVEEILVGRVWQIVFGQIVSLRNRILNQNKIK